MKVFRVSSTKYLQIWNRSVLNTLTQPLTRRPILHPSPVGQWVVQNQHVETVQCYGKHNRHFYPQKSRQLTPRYPPPASPHLMKHVLRKRPCIINLWIYRRKIRAHTVPRNTHMVHPSTYPYQHTLSTMPIQPEVTQQLFNYTRQQLVVYIGTKPPSRHRQKEVLNVWKNPYTDLLPHIAHKGLQLFEKTKRTPTPYKRQLLESEEYTVIA